jgi:hypothetical protein
MRYLVVVEKGPTSFGAYVPIFLDVSRLVTLAKRCWHRSMKPSNFISKAVNKMGAPVPPPTSSSEVIEVAA